MEGTAPAEISKKRSSRHAEIPRHPDNSSTAQQPASEPLRKRRRLHTRTRYTLDRFGFPIAGVDSEQPPSPLFFSNSRRTRPQLPARFSSTESAVSMLSKSRGEDTGIKTVTLARGTFSGLSPPGTTSVPGARNSERSSIPRTASPDGRDKNDSLRILGSVGIVELLEQDPRPTFIIDLTDSLNYSSGSILMVFGNSSLRSNPSLLELVTGRAADSSPGAPFVNTSPRFKSWLLSLGGQAETPEVNPPPMEHGGIIWSCSTLRKRLRVVSGTYPYSITPSLPRSASFEFMVPSSSLPPSSSSHGPGSSAGSNPALVHTTEDEPQDYFGTSATSPQNEPDHPPEDFSEMSMSTLEPLGPGIKTIGFNGRMFGRSSEMPNPIDSYNSFANDVSLPKEIGFFDWTRLPISDSLPRHIQFARSVDWAVTPLGPIEYWSSDLRQMCNLIMASPHPAAMYWGDDLVAIYNEAYVLLAGQKHPQLMGQRYRDAWAEIWDDVKDVFANAKSTGQATMKDDDCLFMKRHNYLEETYFSWSIIPMVGGDGSVMGLYNPAFEKTRRKIAERRMLTLREVGERTAIARDVKGFWEQVLASLAVNEYDTPFVLLYSVSDDGDSDASSMHSSSILTAKHCYLEGALGIPPRHPSAPEQIDLKEGTEGFGPVFREVMKTDKPVVLDIGTGDLPAEMLEGLEWRGFGDPCRSVVVCPIHPTTGDSILGFLVIGVNPRRPYDDDYSLFVQLLSRQLGTSLASVVLFEEEIRRGQKAAKLAAEDRINLSEQLAARTQEARDSETRFTRMAEFSPAGLFIADSQGHITYCNDTWYVISRVPRDSKSTDRWIESVIEEDQPMVRAVWKDLVENTKSINVEFRFKAPWDDGGGNKGNTWVLFSAFPEVYEAGILKSVFGSITNISPQKWAEGFQKRKMMEAVELKRQQENFIDITSHEMRNPLSAILQCADEISTTLNDFRSSGSEKISADLVNSSIDAAQTIALCAQHQKRIVDDVLTLSKIDSAMLMVTPVDVQPLNVVQTALKMFEGEVQTAGIVMELVVSDSFKKLDIDWVKLDPSRVLQVLINLTTNAIKFTTSENERTITVILSASRERPSADEVPLVSFFPTRSKRIDQTRGPDWGDGEEVYLQFAVQDTGRGLNDEEKKLLFQRFSQASPRTHVQYGGSGLGLFISRELTELQGGEIGVASEAGKGSTFAFYVKCRKTPTPKDPAEQVPISLSRQLSDAKPRPRMEVTRIRDFASTPAPTVIPDSVRQSWAQLTVLIVEDNLVNQRVLQKQLKNHGITVHVANHGGEALDKIHESQYWRENGPDAVDLGVLLMDQEMPVMDGLQCTRRIREWEEGGLLRKHIPIIAVTANARSEQIAALLAAGMDDVVSKPFRILDLIPKIEELAAKFPDPPLPEPSSVVPQSTSSAS